MVLHLEALSLVKASLTNEIVAHFNFLFQCLSFMHLSQFVFLSLMKMFGTSIHHLQLFTPCQDQHHLLCNFSRDLFDVPEFLLFSSKFCQVLNFYHFILKFQFFLSTPSFIIKSPISYRFLKTIYQHHLLVPH